MTTMFSLLWLFGSIAAIVFIFKPKPEWKLVATRGRAIGVFVAVFFGLPVLMVIVSPPETTSSSASTAASGDQKTPAQIAEEQQVAAVEAAERRQSDMRSKPEKFLSLNTRSAWKDGFDTIFMLSGSITNTGEIAYKDPVIECEVYSETNTRLGRVRETLYKAIPPGETVAFKEFNMGFADSNWEKYVCELKAAKLLV